MTESGQDIARIGFSSGKAATEAGASPPWRRACAKLDSVRNKEDGAFSLFRLERRVKAIP